MKKVKPDNSKTIYVGGSYEVDKTSGGSVTRTVTYYPVAGAMLTPLSYEHLPKSDDENFESAFRFYLVVFGGEPIESPDGESLEGVG